MTIVVKAVKGLQGCARVGVCAHDDSDLLTAHVTVILTIDLVSQQCLDAAIRRVFAGQATRFTMADDIINTSCCNSPDSPPCCCYTVRQHRFAVRIQWASRVAR